MGTIKLAQRIRSFRKERGLTQEQLAQALGVTAGAVYKWEAELSVPDISLIVALADFFDTSVDVLLGYEMKDNRQEAAVERLREFKARKDCAGLAEAEKALTKYPNSFEVVHSAAALYRLFGIEKKENALLRRACALFEQSLCLLSQNRDPEIGELSIYGSLGQTYLSMGEEEQAVELLKTHNVCGTFDSQIGVALAADCGRPEEAEPYLAKALLSIVMESVQTSFGYLNLYLKRKDDRSAEELLDWMLLVFPSFERPGQTSFLGKFIAICHATRAYLKFREGDLPQSRACLETAKQVAAAFDADPNYSSNRIRFVALKKPMSAYDSIGPDAGEAVRQLIESFEEKDLCEMWRELNENETA